MCGIAGMFCADDAGQADAQQLQRMVSVLRHRGPDDEGVFVDGAVGLGARRLEIVDPAGGRQPFLNEDRSIAVVCNGEIYNHQELRRRLSADGFRFRSHSDTEVLVHAFARYGRECVEHLRGMFAFAAWDARRRELFVARDRLGIKPLYYFWDGRRFLFASEIKALLQHPAVTRDIDPLALDDYMTFTYIPAPRTIFRGIYKLLPGHWLQVSADGVREAEYWDLHFAPDSGPDEEQWAEGLRGELRDAVRAHMPGDGSAGVFLSGGIDSSVVTILAAGLTAEPIETLSIGFEPAEFNELPYARAVASRYATRTREHVLEAKAARAVDTLTWYYDEPFADSSMIPTYRVCQLARESTKVFLAGDGGDEIFAGYPRFAEFQRRAEVDADAAEREYFERRTWITPARKHALYGSSLARARRGYDPFAVMQTHFALGRERGYDALSRIQYMETKTYLAGDLLTKLDRASMAHGLEVRVPLLDHPLVEYAARIPSRYKLRDGVGKYILKRALRDSLPEETMQRAKMGFSMPLAAWFRGELRDDFEALVLSRPRFLPEVFDVKPLRGWWEQHQQGQDLNRFLWALLVLECWGRRFLLGESVGAAA